MISLVLNDPYKLVFHEANKTKHVFVYISDASAID